MAPIAVPIAVAAVVSLILWHLLFRRRPRKPENHYRKRNR